VNLDAKLLTNKGYHKKTFSLGSILGLGLFYQTLMDVNIIFTLSINIQKVQIYNDSLKIHLTVPVKSNNRNKRDYILKLLVLEYILAICGFLKIYKHTHLLFNVIYATSKNIQKDACLCLLFSRYS
jgi:hypothetical protein